MMHPVTPLEDQVLRPLSEMPTEAIGRTTTPVYQNTLTTSLQAHAEWALEGRSDRGNEIANLLNKGPGTTGTVC